MLSGFELPTIFCQIDAQGNIHNEDVVFCRKTPFQSTEEFERWAEQLENIHEEGAAQARPFQTWRDKLGRWSNLPSSEVAFCTVSLQRVYQGKPLNHCVVLLFWKHERKVEIFDARGSDDPVPSLSRRKLLHPGGAARVQRVDAERVAATGPNAPRIFPDIRLYGAGPRHVSDEPRPMPEHRHFLHPCTPEHLRRERHVPGEQAKGACDHTTEV